MRVPGQRSRIASTQRATWAMPPSARSSRATIVSTAWARPMPGDGFGDASGLVVGRRQRLAGVDEAEPAGAGAALAEHHERGGAVGPAIAEVRAAGLLAHGDQPEIAHRLLQRDHLGTVDHLRAQPLGLARRDRQAVGDADLGQAAHDRARALDRGRTPTDRRDDASRQRLGAPSRRRPTPSPHAGRPRRRPPRSDASMPSSASDVTGLSGIPQGTMYSRM